MTKSKMLPTPASSSEIRGQDHAGKLSSLQVTFELPPSAINANNIDVAQPSSTKNTSPISPTSKVTYLQPSETVKARRRSSTTQQQEQQTKKDAFTLPPPPTRSRKIIQMKPRPQEEALKSHPQSSNNIATDAGDASGSNAKTSAATTNSRGGKKQPSSTSVAGRKIARKTAHSLIERRRRSKMNEEFAVLKGLIPACTGEMHKLAILQASIDYVRYLEDCITKLKAQNQGQGSTMPAPTEFRLGQQRASYDDEVDWEDGRAEAERQDEDDDVEMAEDDEGPTSRATALASTSVSPALVAQDDSAARARSRQHSYSSVSTDYRRYSFSTSPAMVPQPQGHGSSYYPGPGPGSGSATHSALTSPALRPQLEMDHEASAALLMLGSDRRSSTHNQAGQGRGMSVRDLLSS